MTYRSRTVTVTDDSRNGWQPLPAETQATLNDILYLLDEALLAIEAGGLYCGDPAKLARLAKGLLAELNSASEAREDHEAYEAGRQSRRDVHTIEPIGLNDF